jgi:hypothetical protein
MRSWSGLLLFTVWVASSVALADFSAFSMAQRSSFRGALLTTAPAVYTAARLAGGLRYAQEPQGDLPVEALSREQLKEEWKALDESRPGLGGAIGLLGTGVVMAIVSIYVLIYGVILLYAESVGVGLGASTVAIVLLGVGAALLIGGVVLAIVGGVKLGSTLRERRRIGSRMDELQQQLDQLEGGGGTAPPPPPMNVYAPVPARLLLARF